MLALAWAARHPERVDGLVLFGGAARGWASMSGPGTQALLSLIDRDWDTFVESAVHAWLGWPDAETGRLAAEWFRDATTPAIARETLREASEIDVSGLLPSVTCPVLVLHRAGSSVVPLEQSRELAASLPDAARGGPPGHVGQPVPRGAGAGRRPDRRVRPRSGRAPGAGRRRGRRHRRPRRAASPRASGRCWARSCAG